MLALSPSARVAAIAFPMVCIAACSFLVGDDELTGTKASPVDDASIDAPFDAPPALEDGSDASSKTPVVLADGLLAPTAIAVVDSFVYVVETGRGQILRIAKAPSLEDAGVTVLASGEASPTGIAADGARISWIVSPFVRQVPRGGGEAPHNAVKEDEISNSVKYITTDGAYLIVATKNFVTSCAVENFCYRGQADAPIHATGDFNGLAVLPADTFAYAARTDGYILKVSRTSATEQVQVLASAQNNPFRVAVDGVNVYWTNHVAGGGAVSRAPMSGADVDGGAAAPTVIHGGGDITELALDDAFVYWIDVATNRIERCAKTGCAGAPETIAADQVDPVGLAVDATSIYWTSRSAGKVFRAEK